MNYTLHQLQVFLTIAQTQSITKAAQELHLSQPAVSIQLRNFQDQFDIPLTEVIGRKLFVTDFGKEIAVAAEKIINEVYAINYKTLAYKGQLSGRLKIAAVSTGKYVMPYFLADFLQQHEGVELVLDVTNKAKVVESLERNEVDFALVSLLPNNLQLEYEPLLQNKLYLVGNADHTVQRRKYDKTIFEKLPLIYREAGSGTRIVMEKFIEENTLQVRKKMELTSNEAVKQSVIAGLGCSLMPLIGLKNELENGELHILPVKGFPIKTEWRLIWLKGKSFTLVADSFLNHIRKQKTKIIQERFAWYEQY